MEPQKKTFRRKRRKLTNINCSQKPENMENPMEKSNLENTINLGEKIHPGSTENSEGKSKAESRAERKAKQKAQKVSKSQNSEKQNDSEKTGNPEEKSKSENSENLVENTQPQSSVDKSESDNTKNSEGKSKSELRAERRAKQEAQRAAKQVNSAKQGSLGKQGNSAIKKNEVKKQKEESKIVQKMCAQVAELKISPKVAANTDNAHEVHLFKHLYERRKFGVHNKFGLDPELHPAIVILGVRYAERTVVGSNARCVAFLNAIMEMIQDHEKPECEDFTKSFGKSLEQAIKYLNDCRPSAISVLNAVSHLKSQMREMPVSMSDKEVKDKLIKFIKQYMNEQIFLAGDSISLYSESKISDGDVILTYGHSSLIKKLLCHVNRDQKKIRVIVVDGRPWSEGEEMLKKLTSHGIECTYILINALSFVMPEVTKVFIGAHTVLANGAIMSRIGTAQVALMARAFNVPVLVACETYKLSDRVQTDSFVHNELGNDDDLVNSHTNSREKSKLTNWRSRKTLNLLNLAYDFTPADFVTAIITELGILPCTSVPVILRLINDKFKGLK